MSFRPRLSTALLASATFLLAAGAQAQASNTTASIYLKNNNEGVVRVHSDAYPLYLSLNQFNQRNCIDNEYVTFNIDIRGGPAVTGAYHLEAWIGTACDMRSSRVGNSASCYNVGIAGQSVERMEIAVRNLVGPLSTSGGGDDTGGTGGTGGTSGTGGTAGLGTGGTSGLDTGGTGGTTSSLGGDTGIAGTFGNGGTDSSSAGTFGNGGTDSSSAGTFGAAGLLPYIIPGGTGGNGTAGTGIKALAETAGTEGDTTTPESGLDGPPSEDGVQPISVCATTVNTTPLSRTLYFVLVDGDGNAPPAASSWFAKWPYNYDMGGPSAPTSVTAGIGESALVMKWTQAPDAPIDLKQYIFLCDPPPGGGSAAPDAEAGAGGEGSEGSTDEEMPPISEELCKANVFTEGQVPTVDVLKNNVCGNVQSTSTGGEAGPLANGVRYAVAMASRDSYWNVGPVSNVTCNTPELVTDFYEAYKMAGGHGGGGFCAIGRVKTHALTTLFMLGALGLIARRRARGTRRGQA